MSYEEEDTCVSYEEEDTCVSYEEEDTCVSSEVLGPVGPCSFPQNQTVPLPAPWKKGGAVTADSPVINTHSNHSL